MLQRTLVNTFSRSLRSVQSSSSAAPAIGASRLLSCSSPIIVHHRQPRASPYVRHASTAAAKSSENEKEVVPPVEQPSTSPDKHADPLNSPAGTEGTDTGARRAATVTDDAQSDKKEKLGEPDDGHTLMSEQEKEILAKLRKEFPGGTVAVQDVSGGCGTFFAIAIESDKFKGLSKIKQHQLVNKILADEVKTWHGMQLKTQAA